MNEAPTFLSSNFHRKWLTRGQERNCYTQYPELKMNNHIIEKVPSTKYLGITIHARKSRDFDCCLNDLDHYEHPSSRVTTSLYASISHLISHFKFVYVNSISHRNPVFHQMTLIRPYKVTKVQSDFSTRSATRDFLLLFHSNYSAISLRNHVFHQMTLIWPFKITNGQTDYAIRFVTKLWVSIRVLQ